MQPEHDLQIFQNVTYVTYVTYFMLHMLHMLHFRNMLKKTLSDIRERLSEVSK